MSKKRSDNSKKGLLFHMPFEGEREEREYHLQPVPELQWVWWFWCNCRVRGQVVRPVEINGVTYDKPVCHARVHICEVDYIYWVIRDLPDLEIWRLRDDLLDLIERPIPFPWPLPDPPPFRYDPGVIDPSPENIAVLNDPLAAVAFNPQPDPPVEMDLISAESLWKITASQAGEIPVTTRANLSSNS